MRHRIWATDNPEDGGWLWWFQCRCGVVLCRFTFDGAVCAGLDHTWLYQHRATP